MPSEKILLNKEYLQILGRYVQKTYPNVFIEENNGSVDYVFVDMNMKFRLIDPNQSLHGLQRFNINLLNLKRKINTCPSNKIELALTYRGMAGDYSVENAVIAGVGHSAVSFSGTPFSQPTNIPNLRNHPKDSYFSEVRIEYIEWLSKKKYQDIVKKYFLYMHPSVTLVRGRYYRYVYVTYKDKKIQVTFCMVNESALKKYLQRRGIYNPGR
jgi:hypothetical protein